MSSRTLDKSLIEHNVDQLMRVRHLSGKDLAYGLLLGLKALQKINT